MKVQIEIKAPTTANFVLAKVGETEVSIPIGELDEKEISEYIALVTKSIKDKWEQRSIIKKADDLLPKKKYPLVVLVKEKLIII